jgi:uncharacterized membrane protein
MNAPNARPRLSSLDWLRGLVMVLMLIDHTRDFVHAESFWHSATDLSVISSVTFLTRWITHFCAPTFVFLAGVGIALQLQAGKPIGQIQRFLWTRGLWLVLLEFTIVHLGFDFTWTPRTDLGVAQVIWVLGLSMIIMAGMIRLSLGWNLAIGLVIVLGHNLLDPIVAGPLPSLGANLWRAFHQGGVVSAPFWGQRLRLYILYPLIPWPGVMALGYCLGSWFHRPSELRRKLLLHLGLACVAAFVLLRAVNHYGDASHWTRQATAFRTGLSFINVTKYPPSLLYLLMTLGPALLVLAWREGRSNGRLDRMLITFGRVPMFFYLLQWYVAHGLGILFHFLRGGNWQYSVHHFGVKPAGIGFHLGAVYGAWGLGLALLYPLCHWFAGIKARRKDWWLSYL